MVGCGEFPKVKYLLQENGDRIELEDGSGWILLEDQDIGKTSSPWKSKGSVFLVLFFADFIQRIISTHKEI